MEFSVRKYQLKDLHAIADLEAQCFEHPWSYDSFCMEYADPVKAYFIAEDKDGNLLGYGGYAHILDEAHIMNIAVVESARHQGVGSAIVDAIIKSAKDAGICAITLEVRNDNKNAIALYEKAGFEFSGLRPHYYGWDMPARIYWLKFE